MALALLAIVLMALSVVALPRSYEAHQHECEHSSCPVAHGCCSTQASALAPSVAMILVLPAFTASLVTGPLARPGIAASSAPFQPPRA